MFYIQDEATQRIIERRTANTFPFPSSALDIPFATQTTAAKNSQQKRPYTKRTYTKRSKTDPKVPKETKRRNAKGAPRPPIETYQEPKIDKRAKFLTVRSRKFSETYPWTSSAMLSPSPSTSRCEVTLQRREIPAALGRNPESESQLQESLPVRRLSPHWRIPRLSAQNNRNLAQTSEKAEDPREDRPTPPDERKWIFPPQ